MYTKITLAGKIIISADSEIEAYALKQWRNENVEHENIIIEFEPGIESQCVAGAAIGGTGTHEGLIQRG